MEKDACDIVQMSFKSVKALLGLVIPDLYGSKI